MSKCSVKDSYSNIADSEEFKKLKRKKYKFIFSIPILFFIYYLTFPLLSAYAKPLMASKVFGDITFGYIFGMSYYLVIWLLAFVYVYFSKSYDQQAKEILVKYKKEIDVIKEA